MSDDETTKEDRPPDGPVILTNRAWVSWSDDNEIVRLIFADQDGPDAPPIYRAAVAMSRSGAKILASLLAQV